MIGHEFGDIFNDEYTRERHADERANHYSALLSLLWRFLHM
jgi:hypothetical protein